MSSASRAAACSRSPSVLLRSTPATYREGTEGATLAHTGDASVDVGGFDFEISGTTFVAVWQDNASAW